MANFYKDLIFATKNINHILHSKVVIEDLTHKEIVTLIYIAKNDDKDLNVKMLQEVFSVKVSSIVQILNRLEEKELIIREVSTNDKRVSIVKATDKSKCVVNKFLLTSEQLLMDSLTSIEDFARCIETLNELVEALKEKEKITIRLESDIVE